MSSLPKTVETLSILLVDHTTDPGGAELALPRIGRHSRHVWKFAFLEPLTGAIHFDADAQVLAPTSRRTLLGQALYLRRILRQHPRHTVASNTLRAALLVTLVKPQGQTHIQLLRDGVSSDSLSHPKRLIAALVFRHVTKILPNSSWTGNSVPQRFQSLVTEPIYSPSGTDTLHPRAPEPRSGQAPLRLLSLSRLVEWKGIHVVLEALGRLSHDVPADRIELTIAGDALMGDPSYVDRLRAMAQTLPFAVTFLAHQNDVTNLLRDHDALVHASTRPEPFGQVIVQGLTSSLVVLASRAGGPAEIIEDNTTGLLHVPGDAESLASSVRSILDDPDLRARLARAGALSGGMFSDAWCVKRLDDEIVSARATTHVPLS